MTTRPVNGRVKTPRECPVGRIMVGWLRGRAVYADIYPSDLKR